VSPHARWGVVFAAASAAGIAVSAVVASGRPILATRWSLLWWLAAWAAAWLVAVVAAFHLPARVAVPAVLAVGLALRLAALAGPPTTSDDLYRYSWDGRVQAAGVDPYAQAPVSQALAHLREPWLWPDAAGCAAIRRPAGCTRINRPGQRTIYPPVAEAWFASVYRVAGFGARAKAWQVAGLLTELGVLGLLPLALWRWGRDLRWLALYALSPAPVLEVVNNGHVDGLAVLCVVGALTVVAQPGDRRGAARDVAAGALLGAAFLVKLYPGIVLVALVGVGARRWAPVVRAGAAAAAVTVVAYLPHVLRVGGQVVGYLPRYLGEEHYTTGGRFLVASLAHVPIGSAGAVSGVAVACACAWVWWRRPPAPEGACVLVGAVLLAASPVQTWYAVLVLALAAIAGRPAWAAVVVAGYPYFFAVILAGRHAPGLGEAAYGAALVVVVLAMARRRRCSASAPLAARERRDVEHTIGVVAARAPRAGNEDGGGEGRPRVAVGVDEDREPARRT
jgi:hypothetical protein